MNARELGAECIAELRLIPDERKVAHTSTAKADWVPSLVVRRPRQRGQRLFDECGGGRGARRGARVHGKRVVGESLPELGGEQKAWVGGNAVQPLPGVVAVCDAAAPGGPEVGAESAVGGSFYGRSRHG
jgi:hypothetical protein